MQVLLFVRKVLCRRATQNGLMSLPRAMPTMPTLYRLDQMNMYTYIPTHAATGGGHLHSLG